MQHMPQILQPVHEMCHVNCRSPGNSLQDLAVNFTLVSLQNSYCAPIETSNIPQRRDFALPVLARMEVDNMWPGNILWTDEAHFTLDGAVNTQNCRVWGSTPPHVVQEQPLHSAYITVWCGFTSSFILGPFFFEEMTPRGPVRCRVTSASYRNLLVQHVIPALQERNCDHTFIFMRDGATPHVARQVKDLLRETFSNDRINSRQFPDVWPSRSPDLNPCEFWLWEYLKIVPIRDISGLCLI